jgi:hypothetical protein
MNGLCCCFYNLMRESERDSLLWRTIIYYSRGEKCSFINIIGLCNDALLKFNALCLCPRLLFMTTPINLYLAQRDLCRGLNVRQKFRTSITAERTDSF